MKIEVIQGDKSKVYKFQRKDDNDAVIETQPQKMWITFKRSIDDKDAVIQKTLTDGITYSTDDHYYRFSLDEEDTNGLECDVYGFDIAIKDENGDKKTLLVDGTLRIMPHYTDTSNEV